MIPQETISRIIEQSDIVAIISEHIKLDKRGVNYIGCCPFHTEKTASFSVSPAKNIYKCFGCGASGNVVKFIEDIEHISWIESIKQLAERAKIELPKRDISPEEKTALDRRERLFIVNQFAQAHFETTFLNSAGRGYMLNRDFNDDDFAAFNIGFAADGWNDLTDASKKAGYKPEIMLEAGLLAKSEAGKVFDRYRDRVIFPIQNVSGGIAGFTGRIINADDKSAKYLNTPETTIFNKSALLYGLFQAKNTIIKEGRCNLVEGNTDVMRWHKCGIKNTVATCGTALTPQHAKLIHRFTNNLTIVFDADSAGIKATIKGIDVCVAEGLNVYIALLPIGEDPDSFARGKTEKEMRTWLEANEKDFIMFRADMAQKEMEDKPAERARIMNDLKETIAKMPDAITRQVYLEEVSKVFNTDLKTFSKGFTVETGDIFGIEANAEAIRSEDAVFIYTNKDDCMRAIASGRENAIAIPCHPLKPEHIGAIEVITKNLFFIDPVPPKIDIEQEPEVIKDYKRLSERGFRVNITPPVDHNYDSDFISLAEAYFRLLSKSCDVYNTEQQKTAIENSAEFLSKQDKTTISIKTGEIAKMFGITKASFEQVLKPYINKNKSKTNIHFEQITVDDERFVIDDIDRLPDYVDKSFLNKYHYFPVQNKNGVKIFYMFRGENSQLFRVGNFYMEPQFQVRHDDALKNKRIVKLNHSELNSSKFVEINSDAFIEFSAFKKFMWRQGPYIFRNGKPQHLDMILDSIALEFPVCDELEIYGRQEEGFYALCNAIFSDEDSKIYYMNELGLISHKNHTYYSPSVSCIYKDVRKDGDKYAGDRFFIFRETNKINITSWASLMLKVYKYNNNGYWSVIMSILAAFRSDIFKVDRLFTTLFLIGPTGCGKSELAQSMRAIYMHPDAPMFNLNAGTDAAFYTALERYRDAIIIMEEYNDMQISDNKFQGLKAAVYDGEGKTKRKDATSKDLDQSQVNAVPLILGQESPERDDASLANRTVILPVKKIEYWTDEETENFQTLKKHEKQGLSNILIEILKIREIVVQQYAKNLRLVQKELRDDLRGQNQPFQPRILNTVSLFAAMVRMIEQHVPTFKLPFTYAEFYPIARKKLIDQSESISQTNRLAVFFDTLMMLSEDPTSRGIIKNKEFKIETHDSIEVRRGRKDEEVVSFDGHPTKLLFLRIDMIHPKYKAVVGNAEHLKINNLDTYLKDHPAYIGKIKMTTFRWETEMRVDDGTGKVISIMKEESKRTSATVLNYKMMESVLDFGDSTVHDSKYYTEQAEDRMKPDNANNSKTDEEQANIDGIEQKLPF